MIDGLRLLAAVMVVLCHFTGSNYPADHFAVWGKPVAQVFPHVWDVTVYGATGVQLFFIISGFVILMSCWGRTLPEFVASRISRLYPAYWVAVALTALLLLVIWPGWKPITVRDVMINLTMMQHPYRVPNIDAVYWTLWFELTFYFLIGLVLLTGVTRNRVIAFAALWPILAILSKATHIVLLTSVLDPSFAPLFAGGMLIYVLSRTGHSVLVWLLLALNIGLSAYETQIGTFKSLDTRFHGGLPNYACWLVILTFFGLVMLATLGPLRHVQWRWLTTAGVLTYPLYLTHQFWGLWLIHLLRHDLPPYPTLAVTIAAVFLLAWLVNRIAERPFRAPLRRAIERSLTRPDRSPHAPVVR
jgi:peptidoglycan/LPS O-acetylase OafA/YrhL